MSKNRRKKVVRVVTLHNYSWHRYWLHLECGHAQGSNRQPKTAACRSCPACTGQEEKASTHEKD
jgi:hypothetical protein